MGCRNTEDVITVPAALPKCQHLIAILSSILGYWQGKDSDWGKIMESSGLELSHVVKLLWINLMSARLSN